MAVVILTTSCSVLFDIGARKTKIVAAPFGKTERVTKYKLGGVKPTGHVIWGDDVEDGSDCAIVITNVSLSRPVFSHYFTYKREAAGSGYNFYSGGIVELDRYWYKKVGRFVVALYVENKRISTDTFDILP